MLTVRSEGVLFIVSAPSGAGKTTISTLALERLENLDVSVSVTTREPRPGERSGVDYQFVSAREFEEMRRRGEFAESAKVHDFDYGTPRAPIDAALGAGRDVLLDIDVQGAAQIRSVYPAAVSIFVLPPSVEELERRLRQRATDPEDVIARRLTRATAEMERVREYDYRIVNREREESVAALVAIVVAERHRTARWRPPPSDA